MAKKAPVSKSSRSKAPASKARPAKPAPSKLAAPKAPASRKTTRVSVSHAVPANPIKQALEAGAGILRLAPTWVPRSFLMPGRRIKLAPQDVYALGAQRGGIDERWFSSTTSAANEGAPADEGLSYVIHENKRVFTLRDAVDLEGKRLVGPAIWDRY